MSILIKGVSLPRENEYLDLVITRDGKVCCYDAEGVSVAEAVEVPAHGDLIDREYAIASACSGRIRALPTTEDGEDWIRVEEVRQSLKSVTAVIPAERSESDARPEI